MVLERRYTAFQSFVEKIPLFLKPSNNTIGDSFVAGLRLTMHAAIFKFKKSSGTLKCRNFFNLSHADFRHHGRNLLFHIFYFIILLLDSGMQLRNFFFLIRDDRN